MTLDLNNAMAVNNDGLENILGNLFWYSIGKQLIKRTDLEQKFIDADVDLSFMPNEIRVVDAFRRATKESETKRETSTAGVFRNYIIREVYADKDIAQRNIVIETVDQSGKRLDYQAEAGIIRLHKENGTLTTQVTNDEALNNMISDINEKFHLYKDYHSAQHLRVTVAGILKGLAPTAVKPNGGIYFVPGSQTKGLLNLITLCNSLESSEGFKIPVVNNFDNRKMVHKKYDDNINSLVNQLTSTDGLTKNQVREIVKEVDTLISDYKDYRGILEEERTGFDTKMVELKGKARIALANIDN